jgi:hypothetical protein
MTNIAKINKVRVYNIYQQHHTIYFPSEMKE